MTIFVTRAENYDLVAVYKRLPGFGLMSYDQLIRSKWLRPARYVFCDLDRLNHWELELAGRFYIQLKEAGLPVLNNPARVRLRFSLINAWKREGINSFGAYRPSDGEYPERYPVFVRKDSSHHGALSDLLHSREELDAELERIESIGIPHSDTMVVEYSAEPAAGDVFYKYAVYRIGDSYFQDTTVTERNWFVKLGEIGSVGEDFFEEEKKRMNEILFEPEVRRAFEVSNIEYGRVDYGILDGKPQFYEINTNPDISFKAEHRSQTRVKSRKIFVENFKAALAALPPVEQTSRIRVRDGQLIRQRRKESILHRSRPIP